MNTRDPKAIAIGAAAIIALVVAAIFIWNQMQALRPNAIYRNAKSPEESRRALEESQKKFQTPQERFQRMKRSAAPGPNAPATTP